MTPRQNPRLAFLLGSILLLAISFLAYWPSLSGHFLWDDQVLLTENKLVQSSDGLKEIWFSTKLPDYFPLTVTSFWLEWRLWGMNPAGYHVTNVLLHAFGAILLWRLLLSLKIPGAWLAAAVFAVHPVGVASVAWIAERKNTLSLVFYLLSAFFYLRAKEEHRIADAPVHSRFYWLSLVAFLLALLSKSSTVVLPVVLLLCVWWKHGDSGGVSVLFKRHLLRLIPFFALALAFGLLTVWLQSSRLDETIAEGRDNLLARLIGGSWAVWFYAWKTVLPVGLMIIYPRWEISVQSIVSYLPALALIFLLAICWRFRAGWGRAALVVLLYFVIALSPVLGVFDMHYLAISQVADHFQYLAMIGLIVLVAAGGTRLTSRAPAPVKYVGAAMILAGLILLTRVQSAAYAGPKSFWSEALRTNPNAWIAHVGLGVALAGEKKLDAAIEHYKRAIAAQPRHAPSHFNLGNALAEKGDFNAARIQFETALQLNPGDPGAHNNLGRLLLHQKQWDAAIQHFEKAIELNPHAADAYANMGGALSGRQKWAEAHRYFEEALRLRPDNAVDHFNIGMSLVRLGDISSAQEHFSQAVALQPDFPEAHYNLGIAATQQRDLSAAIAHYETALLQRPDYPDALNNLAWLRATSADPGIRDGNRALQLAERACKLAKDTNVAYLGVLDAAYAAAGRFDDAIRAAEKTRDLAFRHNNDSLARAASRRLELYRQSQSYQER